uniref:Uncharacterized protein n=1 Tax=Arundo donax TaxID=35708 RepID=A0A0A8Z7Y8_ARUDO
MQKSVDAFGRKPTREKEDKSC